MAAQPAQAFASHLINQTLSSIALLESLALLNPSDASLIRQKLPSPTGPFPSLAPPSPSASFANLNIAQSPSSWAVQHRDNPSQQQSHSVASTPGPPTLPPRQHPPAEQRAKALWDFSGTQADDLQFRSGDILIIDEEVNDQWSRGRVIPNGHHAPLPRSGLFPSNYVEKIEPQLQQSHQPPQQIPYYQSSPNPGGMVPYQPPQQPYYDHKQPMHMMPPQQQMQGGVSVQQPEQNKGKYGKLGGQLGTAAVTGVGFGAGSAVGSGIINSIF